MLSSEIKVGDILVSSWGYSMILNSWYQVVKRTAKTVTVREICSKTVNGNGFQGESMPIPDQFHVGANADVFHSKKLHHNGDRPFIKMTDYEYAYLWDGTPEPFDHLD